MFLHSGASLHGHEYSPRRSSPRPPHKQLPLLRSALRPVSDGDTLAFSPVDSVASDYGPLNPVDSPGPRPTLRQRPVSDMVSKRELSVRFYEPRPASISSVPFSEEESIAESDISDATDSLVRHKRPKRAPRQSTRFALAHPAPALRTKQRRLVQLRPRLLLQLQRVGEKRAVPAFDIIPSGLIAGSVLLPKLAKKLRRKHELCQDDVIIARSEDYDSVDVDAKSRRHSLGGDSLDHRDVVGVISAPHSSSGKGGEVVLDDGTSWFAEPMANGSFEFTNTDIHGHTTIARWVRRCIQTPKRSSVPESPPVPEYKWTFSVIDPATRRHPILGVLKSHTLEIFDKYSTMSTSSGRYPPTRPFSNDMSKTTDGSSSVASSPSRFAAEERVMMSVSEEDKKLMLATGIFVSLRQEGWPAAMSPRLAKMNGHGRSVSSGASVSASGPQRPLPIGTTTPVELTPPPSPPEGHGSAQQAAEGLYDSDVVLSREEPAPMPQPGRSMSTGAAFMRRRMTKYEKANGKSQSFPLSGQTPRLEAHKEDEKTHTCRLRLRRIAHKILRRPGKETAENEDRVVHFGPEKPRES